MLLKEIAVTIFIIIAALYTNNSVNSIINNNANNSDCVIINGGGFSGFWYYYGYLKSNNIANKPIYCHSSGCVAYVASISSNDISYYYDLANKLVI
jgi:hypothetical protein